MHTTEAEAVFPRKRKSARRGLQCALLTGKQPVSLSFLQFLNFFSEGIDLRAQLIFARLCFLAGTPGAIRLAWGGVLPEMLLNAFCLLMQAAAAQVMNRRMQMVIQLAAVLRGR